MYYMHTYFKYKFEFKIGFTICKNIKKKTNISQLLNMLVL